MKRLLLILSIITSIHSFAQMSSVKGKPDKKHALGLHFGGNAPSMDNPSYSSYFKPELGFSAGIIYNFSPFHFISIEARPTINKVVYSFETSYFDNVGNPLGNIKFMHSTTHFTLPVMADLHNNHTIKGHLYIGLFYAKLINAATNSDKPYYGETHINRTDDYSYSDKNKTGACFGAGISAHKPGTRLGVNLQYLYNQYFTTTFLSYHNFSLNVSYHF